MVFGCDREEKEALYSIIYFHKSSFELSGLPVGLVSAFGARELPYRAHDPGIGLGHSGSKEHPSSQSSLLSVVKPYIPHLHVGVRLLTQRSLQAGHRLTYVPSGNISSPLIGIWLEVISAQYS